MKNLFFLILFFLFIQAQNFQNEISKRIDHIKLEDFWTGAAFIDLDQDGDDDLIVTDRIPGRQMRKSRVYENTKGFFKYLPNHAINQEAGYWFGITSGDYNNDGLIDVYIAGYHGALYKNIGNGNFKRVNVGIWADKTLSGICAGFADLNNDGNLDLIVTRPEWIPGAPWHGEPSSPHVLLNSGAPNYTFARHETSDVSKNGKDTYMQPTLFDYDDDLDIDLFIGMGSGVSKIDLMYINTLKTKGEFGYKRMRNNTISEALVEGNQWSFIDVDNDGDWDVHVTNWANVVDGKNFPRKNFLFLNENNGYKQVREGEIYTDEDMTTTALWGDFDNDADQDMISVSDSNYTLKYYQNNGKGNFTRIDVGELSRTDLHQSGGSIADIDADGDLDLFIPGPASNSTLFVNDLNNGYNWVKFKLIGKASNKSAIGAQIKVFIVVDGKEIVQRQNISTSNVFFGQNSIIQHFGLNKASSVKKVEIRWPSGRTDIHKNLAINQTLVLAEESRN